jgi:hypothetical protein
MLVLETLQGSKGLMRMNDIWTCAGFDDSYLRVADYHYSYAEGNLVHAVSDFAVRYDRWMMLSSFPGP